MFPQLPGTFNIWNIQCKKMSRPHTAPESLYLDRRNSFRDEHKIPLELK